MPVNRNALIRYKTLDKCLQNRYRKWTLDDLIDACSDALYEYEGIDKGVSKRTIQGDLQTMRSDKLGYNAPIIVVDKKYYTYEDSNYSITNIPLSDQDLGMLTEAIAFMKQFKGFSHFRELEGMVQKLEDHIYSQKTATTPVIDFEKNEGLKGLEYLDILYQTIIQKKAITIGYQSFKARKASSFDFHPYLLKEFRNRWFLIGRKEGATPIMNLALDRILEIKESTILLQEADFDGESYFKNVIGVSVSPNSKIEEVLLYISRHHAPYIETKPLHPSQKTIEKDYYGSTISLRVQLNFELEKEILALGEAVRVIAPERLKRSIKERVASAIDLYNTEISEKGLKAAISKMNHKGLATLHHVYTQKEIKNFAKNLGRLLGDNLPYKIDLLADAPDVIKLLINKNIRKISRQVSPSAQLAKATYYQNAPTEDYCYRWHQSQTTANSFVLQIHLDDTSSKNSLQIFVLGSHKKQHNTNEIDFITQNSVAWQQEINAAAALLLHPLLITQFTPNKSNKKRRVVRLEFCH